MDYITRNLETVVEQVTKRISGRTGNRTATGGKDDDASETDGGYRPGLCIAG